MHSYDRTLLAKLGFSDPDKKNPWHDYACQYLAQPHVLKQIYATFGAQKGWVPSVKVSTGELEYHLTKGQGQYRTTIGFLDLRATGFLKQEFRDRPQSCAPDSPDSSTIVLLTLPSIIEVKVKPVPLGDLIRQVKLYSEYFPWNEHRANCHFFTKATQVAEGVTRTETNFCHTYKSCQACKEGSVECKFRTDTMRPNVERWVGDQGFAEGAPVITGATFLPLLAERIREEFPEFHVTLTEAK